MVVNNSVGFKNWVTSILYLSLLNPCVAKAETKVSALNGIAIAKIMITHLSKGGPFKIFVTMAPDEMINATIITNENIVVILKADAIIF